MKIYISHSSNFDYNKELYKPLKDSKLSENNILIFPHEGEVKNSKPIIKECDLVIAEVSFPSIGQGIELGWADYLNIPILCIYKETAKISSSLKLITNLFVKYSDQDDMIEKIIKTYFKKGK